MLKLRQQFFFSQNVSFFVKWTNSLYIYSFYCDIFPCCFIFSEIDFSKCTLTNHLIEFIILFASCVFLGCNLLFSTTLNRLAHWIISSCFSSQLHKCQTLFFKTFLLILYCLHLTEHVVKAWFLFLINTTFHRFYFFCLKKLRKYYYINLNDKIIWLN